MRLAEEVISSYYKYITPLTQKSQRGNLYTVQLSHTLKSFVYKVLRLAYRTNFLPFFTTMPL